MTEPRPDPLDVLALPVDQVLPDAAPDPVFAAGLRARLERVLLLPDTRRTPVTQTLPDVTAGASTLTPYLAVADARAALDFYARAFGAVPRGEPYVSDDGRVGHAEVVVGGALLMLADEHPELGLLGPLARGGVSTTLHLQVPDVDAVVARAVSAGAVLEREPADAPYGRTGVVRDPSGHRWMLQTAVAAGEDAPAEGAPGEAAPAEGDVAYVTVAVLDAQAAREFYGAVLGWRFTPGGAADGWSVAGTTPAVGLWGGQSGRPEVHLCYRVGELARAVAAVLAGGGTAQEPEDKPYGRLVECTDPAGLRFQLWQPPEG